MNSNSDIFGATPDQVVRALDLGSSPAKPWRAEDLGAVFRHQMAAPVSVELTSLPPRVSAKLKTLADAHGLLLKSFADLFQHPRPPLELLKLVKDYAKRNREHPESSIPAEVATVLYLLSIAAALVRQRERITKLENKALLQGFRWATGLEWVDEPSRTLLAQAERILARTTKGGPPSTQS